MKEIRLTKTNYKDYLPIDIAAFSDGFGARMGDVDIIRIATFSGAWFEVYWGDFSHEELSDAIPLFKEYFSPNPSTSKPGFFVKMLYWLLCHEKFPSEDEVMMIHTGHSHPDFVRYDMGYGNYLNIHYSIAKKFRKKTKSCKSSPDYFLIWESVVAEILEQKRRDCKSC